MADNSIVSLLKYETTSKRPSLTENYLKVF